MKFVGRLHLRLAWIARASDYHLRCQVRYLQEQTQISRARIAGQLQSPDACSATFLAMGRKARK